MAMNASPQHPQLRQMPANQQQLFRMQQAQQAAADHMSRAGAMPPNPQRAPAPQLLGSLASPAHGLPHHGPILQASPSPSFQPMPNGMGMAMHPHQHQHQHQHHHLLQQQQQQPTQSPRPRSQQAHIQQADNTMFMNFPQNFTSHDSMPAHHHPAARSVSGQYPFAAASPPDANASFMPRPAPEFEMADARFEPNAFAMPQRPPSNPAPIQHHSPMSMSPHQHALQRPLSQPQQPPGPSRTPRPGSIQMPPSAPPPNPRLPPAAQRNPVPGSHPPPNIIDPHTLRQPPAAPLPTLQPSTSAEGPRSAAPAHPSSLIGNGQGVMRLLQFSGLLSAESSDKLQLSWWNDTIQKYFTPKAIMKLTLWKDNQRNEAKPFEIGVPILPRFFLVTTQSGVKSMTLSLNGARERLYMNGHSVVECVTAVWTFNYTNGYTVTLRGPLTAHVVVCAPSQQQQQQQANGGQAPSYMLKFDDFQFDANLHDKYIACDAIIGTKFTTDSAAPKTPRQKNSTPGASSSAAPTPSRDQEDAKKWDESSRVLYERASLPGEPVNAFGIPQATMRCLELAESVGQMADLISFSTDNNLGPLDALSQFASSLREHYPHLASLPLPQPTMNGMYPAGSQYPGTSAANSPAMSLYPSSSNNLPAAPTTSPPNNNAPGSVTSSPQKQHKTIPQSAAASSSSSSLSQRPASASMNPSGSSTGGGTGSSTSTPSMPNASLKRKQAPGAADSGASPTMANTDTQPPAKRERGNRKRRATGNS